MTKDEIMEEWRTVRTDAITEMFSNEAEYGIFPTSKFFKTIDDWLSQTLDSLECEQDTEEKQMKNKTVIEIVTKYLKKNRYDGLCNFDCGCHLDDLMPCDSDSMEDCRAGYKGKNDDYARGWNIQATKPRNSKRCVTKEK